MFIPSRISGSGYRIGPVCLSVQNLVEALTFIISRMSSKVKLIGHRSGFSLLFYRSYFEKVPIWNEKVIFMGHF